MFKCAAVSMKLVHGVRNYIFTNERQNEQIKLQHGSNYSHVNFKCAAVGIASAPNIS